MSAPLSAYYKLFEQQLKSLAETATKPRLLLHSCCGPCSSAVLELLASHFEISIFYYNPNIFPEAEYIRRRDEQCSFVRTFFSADTAPKVIVPPYNPDEFYHAVQNIPGFETEPERGSRCLACYTLRLRQAALYAKEHNFDFFTTTLSISPYKDAQKINDAGLSIEQELGGVQYLFADFKKKNGFKRSLELSAQYGLYRQDYCGCIFSKNNR